MLFRSKIVAKVNVDLEAKIKITSSYDYIEKTDATKSKLLKDYDLKTQSFKQIFGFDKEFEANETNQQNGSSNYVNYYLENQEIIISGYSNLLNFSNNNNITHRVINNILIINNKQKEYNFDLNNITNDLFKEYGLSETNIQMIDKLIIVQGNSKLVITNISFNVNKSNNKIDILSAEGYLLEK